jgi:hypothetical protein
MAGQRIDDHSFWAGRPGKDSRFPDGAKTKDESSAEGAGRVMRYEDTTEAIKDAQMQSTKHIKGRPLKPCYRY